MAWKQVESEIQFTIIASNESISYQGEGCAASHGDSAHFSVLLLYCGAVAWLCGRGMSLPAVPGVQAEAGNESAENAAEYLVAGADASMADRDGHTPAGAVVSA